MINKLIFWLEGITEDTPLTDEIDIIVFKINVNGNYKFLELIGLEKQTNLNQMLFSPLEAQFFNIKQLFCKDENVFLYRIKNIIEEAFSSEILKQQFYKRKIYLLYKNVYASTLGQSTF